MDLAACCVFVGPGSALVPGSDRGADVVLGSVAIEQQTAGRVEWILPRPAKPHEFQCSPCGFFRIKVWARDSLPKDKPEAIVEEVSAIMTLWSQDDPSYLEQYMNLPASANCLLFDMDGTLVDTEPVGPRNFLNQLAKYGKQPTSEEYELFTKIWRRDGTDIKQDDWLPEIARKYGIKRTPEEYLKEFYTMYVEAIIAAPALPGVGDFLQKVKASGKYKAALVTASKQYQVKAIIKHHGWEGVFDVLVTSEDFTKHKPEPEPFLAGIQRLGARPEECVVLEDSKNGARSGKAAGCYVIGLRVGNSKLQDLSSADVVVDSFSDITLA